MEGLVDGELQPGELRPDRILEAPHKGAAVSLLQGDLAVLDEEKAVTHVPRPLEMARSAGISSFSAERNASICVEVVEGPVEMRMADSAVS